MSPPLVREALASISTLLGLLAIACAIPQQDAPLLPATVMSVRCGTFDDPWGHKCDLPRDCDHCYYGDGRCKSCNAQKQYLLCGTPAEQLCDNSAHSVKCGKVVNHQTAQSAAECTTCEGTGSNTGNDCNKNSCKNSTVPE
jgi:hypothetical protein